MYKYRPPPLFSEKQKKGKKKHAHSRTSICRIDLHLYMYSTKGKSIYESYVHTYV